MAIDEQLDAVLDQALRANPAGVLAIPSRVDDELLADFLEMWERYLTRLGVPDGYDADDYYPVVMSLDDIPT